MPVILTLDVGFAALGFAAIDPVGPRVLACGTLRTAKSAKKRGVRVADDDCRRCMEQARALVELVREHAPAVVVAEVPGGGAKSARATRAMALGTGIVTATLSVLGYATVWTTPRDGKLATAGKANASKEEVEHALRCTFTGARDSLDALKRADREHAADAIAAYLAAQHDPLVLMAAKEVAR